MKVRVLKEYVGRNSCRLHKVGEEEEWSELGKYSKALIENGFVKVVEGATDRWKPNFNEEYWVVSDIGKIDNLCWRDDGLDQLYHKCRNCFKTENEALHALEWLRACRVLARDSKKSMQGPEYSSVHSVWMNVGEPWIHSYARGFAGKSACDNPFPFASHEDAQRSITEHRKEWLTFFGVSD